MTASVAYIRTFGEFVAVGLDVVMTMSETVPSTLTTTQCIAVDIPAGMLHTAILSVQAVILSGVDYSGMVSDLAHDSRWVLSDVTCDLTDRSMVP